MGLFALSLCALVAAAVLTMVVLTDSTPERAEASAAAGSRPSPTARSSVARETGLPMCLIGTWRTVDEAFNVKFYTDQPELPMTGAGRVYEFKPDGTGTERQDNVTLTGSFRGNQLRIVGNGVINFTWKADDHVITYLSQTGATLAWSYFDQRGFLSTQPLVPNPNLNELENYQCAGGQMAESNDHGYRSVWQRVAGPGMYG